MSAWHVTLSRKQIRAAITLRRRHQIGKDIVGGITVAAIEECRNGRQVVSARQEGWLIDRARPHLRLTDVRRERVAEAFASDRVLDVTAFPHVILYRLCSASVVYASVITAICNPQIAEVALPRALVLAGFVSGPAHDLERIAGRRCTRIGDHVHFASRCVTQHIGLEIGSEARLGREREKCPDLNAGSPGSQRFAQPLR